MSDRPAPRPRFQPALLLWLAVPLLLWWALRGIPLSDVFMLVARLGLQQIIILVALNVGMICIFAARWLIILKAHGHSIPYPAALVYWAVSFAFSYFTPGPHIGGEPLLVYLAHRRHGIPTAAAASSVALDKLLGFAVNLFALLAGLFLMAQFGILGNLALAPALILVSVLLFAMVGFILVLAAGAYPVTGMMSKFPAFIQRLPAFSPIYSVVRDSEALIASFCRGRPLRLVSVIGVSVTIWVLLLFEFWISMRFLGLDLTPPQLVAVVTVARAALLFPVPGGLGILEAGEVMTLRALGLDPAFGVSLGVLIRARDLALGGLGLWWGGLLLGGWRAQRSRPTDV